MKTHMINLNRAIDLLGKNRLVAGAIKFKNEVNKTAHIVGTLQGIDDAAFKVLEALNAESDFYDSLISWVQKGKNIEEIEIPARFYAMFYRPTLRKCLVELERSMYTLEQNGFIKYDTTEYHKYTAHIKALDDELNERI